MTWGWYGPKLGLKKRRFLCNLHLLEMYLYFSVFLSSWGHVCHELWILCFPLQLIHCVFLFQLQLATLPPVLRLGAWLLGTFMYPRFSIQLSSCCHTWLQEKAFWNAGCFDIISSLTIATGCCFLLRNCKSLINMKDAVIVIPSQREAWGVCPKFSFVLWINTQNSTFGSKFRGCVWGWTPLRKVLSHDCNNIYRKDFTIST